jgi:hypothetical protein
MSTRDSAPASAQPMLRIPRSAHPAPTSPSHASRRISPLAYVGVLLVLVGALLAGSQAIGWFRTTGQMSSSSGEHVAPAAGADTSEIKGWMTLQQILDAYPVSAGALYAHLGISTATDPSTTLSELKESGVGAVDVPALRAWIADGAPA